VAGLFELFSEAGVLGLELHDPLDALEVHALIGQLGDALQELDVGVAVAAVASLRAGGLHETASLVDPQVWGCIPASSAATEIT
jgi:hypothetical protein